MSASWYTALKGRESNQAEEHLTALCHRDRGTWQLDVHSASGDLLRTASHGTGVVGGRYTPLRLKLHRGTHRMAVEGNLPCQVDPCFLPSAQRGAPVSNHSQISVLQKL